MQYRFLENVDHDKQLFTVGQVVEAVVLGEAAKQLLGSGSIEVVEGSVPAEPTPPADPVPDEPAAPAEPVVTPTDEPVAPVVPDDVPTLPAEGAPATDVPLEPAGEPSSDSPAEPTPEQIQQDLESAEGGSTPPSTDLELG